MKKYINLRTIALVVLFIVAAFGLLAEADNLTALAISKVAGGAAALALVILYRRWRGKGYLDEIERAIRE